VGGESLRKIKSKQEKIETLVEGKKEKKGDKKFKPIYSMKYVSIVCERGKSSGGESSNGNKVSHVSRG